jgi:hypothetical protein
MGVDKDIRRKGGQIQVTCSVSRGHPVDKSSSQGADTAPQCRVQRGKVPLAADADACPNQNNPLELEACPSASRTRPQTFNTTTSQQDETHTTDSSHGSDLSSDHCAISHCLALPKLFHPTPAHRRDAIFTWHWPHIPQPQHALDLCRIHQKSLQS